MLRRVGSPVWGKAAGGNVQDEGQRSQNVQGSFCTTSGALCLTSELSSPLFRHCSADLQSNLSFCGQAGHPQY